MKPTFSLYFKGFQGTIHVPITPVSNGPKDGGFRPIERLLNRE